MKILFHMRMDFGYGGITEDSIHLLDLMSHDTQVQQVSTLFLNSEIAMFQVQQLAESKRLQFLKKALPQPIKRAIKGLLQLVNVKNLMRQQGKAVQPEESKELPGLQRSNYQQVKQAFEYVGKKVGKNKLSLFSHDPKTSEERKLWIQRKEAPIEPEEYNYILFPFFVEPAYFKSDKVCILRLYDLSFITFPECYTKATAAKFERLLQGAVDSENVLFVCDSPFARDCLEQYYPKTKGRNYVVPCRVPYYGEKKKEFKKARQFIERSISNRYLLPSNRDKVLEQVKKINQYILVVGAAHARKNYETLLEGWKKYKKQNGDKALPLVWVGYSCPEYTGTFLRDAKPLINDGTMFHLDKVPREHLNQLFLNASLFVVASHEEGFSIPPIEANQFGCPVIASDIPVHRWVLDGAAEFFPTEDSSKLAESMQYLTLDTEGLKKAEKLIQAGKENAKRFYRDRIQKELSQVLKEIRNRKATAQDKKLETVR